VSNENEVIWRAQEDFQLLEEDVQNRIREILREVLSTSFQVKVHPAEVEQQAVLYTILRDAQNTEEIKALQQGLLEGYAHSDPYYALAAEIIYDVPGKASDEEEMFDASDETYTALLTAVCPAKLSEASLGYTTERIRQLERRWEIRKPVVGFLYPSFRDRSTDLNEAVFYTKIPGTEPIIQKIFQMREENIPETKSEKRDRLASLLTAVRLSPEEAAAVTESIQEIAEERPEAILDKREITALLQENTDADLEDLETLYEENIPQEIPVSIVVDKRIKISTDTCEVKINTDHAEMIRDEVIDGIRYICVPADGNITVNGITTSGRNRDRRPEETDTDYLLETDE
ncbi:MAG: DUF4317 family protein, partial [Eubacterium sp.]|nr:DUF4317 family protein [Eubacterium sp.]